MFRAAFVPLGGASTAGGAHATQLFYPGESPAYHDFGVRVRAADTANPVGSLVNWEMDVHSAGAPAFEPPR